jgi:hypothetical protein
MGARWKNNNDCTHRASIGPPSAINLHHSDWLRTVPYGCPMAAQYGRKINKY